LINLIQPACDLGPEVQHQGWPASLADLSEPSVGQKGQTWQLCDVW